MRNIFNYCGIVKDVDFGYSIISGGLYEGIAGIGIIALSAIFSYVYMQENINELEEKQTAELKTFSIEERGNLRELCQATA